MAYEKRDNSGALFKNDRKESDKHPDYKGDLTIGGQDYWLSAWIKKSSTGKSFMSLAVTPKERREEKPTTKPVDDDPIF